MAQGRQIITSDLVFVEKPETVPAGQRPKTVTIRIDGDDITQDRVIKIADADGYITGLLPGTGWAVSRGGTGLTSVPARRIPVGTGTDTMYLTPAPTAHNDFLVFDGVLANQWVPAPLDLSGIEATSAINIPAQNGVYSSKIGSQLRFKGIAVSGGVLTLADNGSTLTIGLNPASLTLPASNITGGINLATQTSGVLPVNRGGTGVASLPANQLIAGGTSGVVSLPLPGTAGAFLRANSDNTGYVWSGLNLTLPDTFSGGLDFPENGVQTLNLKWPFACNLIELVVQTNTGGTATVGLLKGGTSVGSINATSAGQTLSLTGQTFAAGDVIRLSLSSLNNVSRLDFTINYSRTV